MPQTYSQTPLAARTSGLAIASLALSCLAALIGPFGFLPGIICGHMARSECRRDPRVVGDGLALAGLIVGYVFLGIFLVLLPIMLLVLFGSTPDAPFVYTLF